MDRHKVPPFRTPCKRRCAQCKTDIARLISIRSCHGPGKTAWALDHHVFNSPECVDMWEDIRRLL